MSTVHPNERNEDFARWIWTMVIVGFFTIQAVIWLVAIALTSSDPSFALAPQYEQAAEHWDDVVAQRGVNQALGWKIEFAADVSPNREPTKLSVRLIDCDGQPVEDAQIDLVAFHCARAAETEQLSLRALGQGRYECDVHMSRPGMWKLNGTAQHGADLYSFDCKQRFELREDAR